jgi:hypothetical protein
MLFMLLFSSGCGAPPGPPGVGPGKVPPGVKPPGQPGARMPQKPAQKPVAPPVAATVPTPATPPANLPGQPPRLAGTPPGKNPVLPGVPQASEPGARVEQAGNTVELASAIISAKGNPFLNKLPKPDIPVANPGGTDPGVVAPPPANPLENINLLGVVYSRKNPLALVSVGGGENQSQMVRKGEVIMMDVGPVKVVAIKPDGIELEMLDGDKRRETKSLPSIVNYAASSTGGGVSSSSGGDRTGVSGSSAGAEDKPELPNLKRLSTGKNSPDVDLQEP